jgi:hypothetical protein
MLEWFLSVLMCDIWINVLLQTSALVGPLYIVNFPVYLYYDRFLDIIPIKSIWAYSIEFGRMLRVFAFPRTSYRNKLPKGNKVAVHDIHKTCLWGSDQETNAYVNKSSSPWHWDQRVALCVTSKVPIYNLPSSLSKRSLLKQMHVISQRLSHKHLIYLKKLSNTVPEFKTKYSTVTSQPVKCCADRVRAANIHR